MRCLAVLLCFTAISLGAQTPPPLQDSARVESEVGVCALSEIAAKQSSTARQRIRILWVSREAMVIMSQ